MRYVLIALLLAGCASRSELMERQMTSYVPMCEKLGFKADTDAFRDCQLRLYQADGQGVVPILIR